LEEDAAAIERLAALAARTKRIASANAVNCPASMSVTRCSCLTAA